MYHFEKTEEINMDVLQDELEQRLGAGTAQDIIDSLRKSGRMTKAPDYMEVKAMSEMQEKFRAQAMMAVWRLKEWRKRQTLKACHENLIQMEGVFLERQCQDAIKLYRQAHQGYFSMYRQAMESLTAKALRQWAA